MNITTLLSPASPTRKLWILRVVLGTHNNKQQRQQKQHTHTRHKLLTVGTKG